MADDAAGGASPKNEPVQIETKEDAETRAARHELKQSSISDPAGATDDKAARPATPASDVPDAPNDSDLKDKIASPKKKRAHDQLDVDQDNEEADANSVASTDSAKDRASRTEPEKKRHRDEETKDEAPKPTDNEATKLGAESTEDSKAGLSPTKQTSDSAFAASAFGKLSSSSSPFAVLGASKGSGFGSGLGATPTLRSFASSPAPPAAQPAAAPKLTFGGTTGASPFAGLASGSNGFGSTLGGSGFGSALGSTKPLGSFAAPKKDAIKSEKPAKPFGAPESDAEDDEEEDDGDEEAQPEETERAVSPEKDSDDKKKLKLQKVEVNDGEAGEATVLSVRAKMFYHDKEAGWKERGAGMLKINVPQACVDFDETGAVIPGTFDSSGLEIDVEEGTKGHKVARLILRQDQTHRVILNTAILPAMEFQEKASLKSVGILFTAFEGESAKPVSITMRMSAANAKAFMNEISVIKRELRSN